MKPDLYTIEFYRFIRTLKPKEGKKIVQTFRDELGKITVAKWELKNSILLQPGHLWSYQYRLDARSIRYMKRAVIYEGTVDIDRGPRTKPYRVMK